MLSYDEAREAVDNLRYWEQGWYEAETASAMNVSGKRPPEHTDGRYLRYHMDVHFPAHIGQAVAEFLPPAGQELKLSPHYRRIQAERKLPDRIVMPRQWHVIEATVTRDTRVVYRALVRFVWNQRSDLALVLEGDWEIVTAYWQSPSDWHYDTLDKSQYVQEGEDQ